MKRIVCLMMSVLVLMAFASFSLAESATATPEATATVEADETAYVGTITAIDTDAKTVTVSGTTQNLNDVLAAVAADATTSPAADATEAPAADATVAADAAQEMTFAITDESVLSNAVDATATLTIADLTVGMPVCITFSGDETNGYSALTIQTLPELPTMDAAAADDAAATDDSEATSTTSD